MGTDARIKDLTGELISSELQALLSELYVAVDGDSMTDAQKVKWSALLHNDAVTKETDNNYQAMTPESFYASQATVNKYGVMRFSTAQEITDRESNGAISAFNLRQVQRDERERLFKEDTPEYYLYGGVGTSVAFPYVFSGNLSVNTSKMLTPSAPSNYKIDAWVISIAVTCSLGSGAIIVSGIGNHKEYSIGSSGMTLKIAYSTIKVSGPSGVYVPSLRISANVNATYTED
jgi:hypothetical protein